MLLSDVKERIFKVVVAVLQFSSPLLLLLAANECEEEEEERDPMPIDPQTERSLREIVF